MRGIKCKVREESNKRHVRVHCVGAYIARAVFICICMHVNMCVHANVGLQVFLCVCVAALSQPSAPPAGKGPGLRHQLQAGMRMAESQTDTAVGYYV